MFVLQKHRVMIQDIYMPPTKSGARMDGSIICPKFQILSSFPARTKIPVDQDPKKYVIRPQNTGIGPGTTQHVYLLPHPIPIPVLIVSFGTF